MSLITPTVAPTLTLAPSLELENPVGSVECCQGCICCASDVDQDFLSKRVVVTQEGLISPQSKEGCVSRSISKIFHCCCFCFFKKNENEEPRKLTPDELHDYLRQTYGDHVAEVVGTYLKFEDNKVRVSHVRDGVQQAKKIHSLKDAVKKIQFHLKLQKAIPANDFESMQNIQSLNATIRVIKGNFQEDFEENILRTDLENMGVDEEYINIVTPRVKNRILNTKNENPDEEILITTKQITTIILSELKAENYESPIRDADLENDSNIIEILEEKELSQFNLAEFKKFEASSYFAGARKFKSDFAQKPKRLLNKNSFTFAQHKKLSIDATPNGDLI